MARTITRIAVFLLAIAASLVGLFAFSVYLEFHDSETLRYRLTYEVMVDGEVRPGAGVVQVHIHKDPSGIGFEVTGEAIVVDLGDRGYLFSLFSGRVVRFNEGAGHVTTPDKLLWLAFSCPSSGVLDYFHCLDRTQPSVELPFTLLPELATIVDVDDPTSLALVDPDDLAASFGPGTSLKRVTMEITDDPVTEGRIGELLVWLDGWEEHVTADKTFYRGYFVR